MTLFHVEQKLKNKMVVIEKCPVCENAETELFVATKDFFLTKENFNIVNAKPVHLLSQTQFLIKIFYQPIMNLPTTFLIP